MSLTMKKRKRIEEILLTIQLLGFVSRSQLQEIHALKSDRNALKVLGSMKEWVHCKPSPERFNENVYYLNKEGSEMIGEPEERRWTQSVEHYLMRNDLYIHYKMPESFHVEPEIQLATGLTQKYFRPDAYFVQNNTHYFIEVDRTQKMLENKKKIEQYAELDPYLQNKYGAQAKVIFYTSSLIRKDKLTGWCQEHKVKCSVLTIDDLN